MIRRASLTVLVLLAFAAPAQADGPTVRFDTSLGAIDVRLFSAAAPNTVTNFLRYVRSGAYTDSYFHRSVRNFIIQGGGFTWRNEESAPINELIADGDPFKRSNQRGTIAVARVDGEPNRATGQWFFNQSDNAALDESPNNYTVFGRIDDRASLTVMDSIGFLNIVDATGGQANSAFGQLPVRGYESGPIGGENLVFVRSITVVPEPATPYAMPFRLKRSNIVVRRRALIVRRLPAGAFVVVRRGRLRRVTIAPRGTARVRLRRRKGAKLKVTVTPSGVRPSSVTLTT